MREIEVDFGAQIELVQRICSSLKTKQLSMREIEVDFGAQIELVQRICKS